MRLATFTSGSQSGRGVGVVRGVASGVESLTRLDTQRMRNWNSTRKSFTLALPQVFLLLLLLHVLLSWARPLLINYDNRFALLCLM